MEQKRITLNISGVNITLITNESEEYIHSLERETEKLINELGANSLERAAITAALSFLDERNKLMNKLNENKVEITKLISENEELRRKNETLLKEIKLPKPIKKVKNPIRELTSVEEDGLITFYERKALGGDENE